MTKFLLFFLFIFLSTNTYSTLLDKVAGVINDNVYTLSEISRVQKTLKVRQTIVGFIYKSTKLSKQQILTLLQNNFIVKDKLSEMGFVISDDAVDSRINESLKGMNYSRAELIRFLKGNGITYNEYYELIREAMEHQVFQRRIIAPLVTITDQEIKNLYYKLNKNNKALSFKYKVVNFSLPKNKILKEDLSRLPAILENYRRTGNIPAIYSDIATNDLGQVSDEDLPSQLSSILRKTDEKTFSKQYIKDSMVHIFYVSEKDLVESNEFLKQKPALHNAIFTKRSDKLSASWLSRESLNYYILRNI